MPAAASVLQSEAMPEGCVETRLLCMSCFRTFRGLIRHRRTRWCQRIFEA